MRRYAKCMNACEPEDCVLIAPPEVTDYVTNIGVNWAQSRWLVGGVFGGFLCDPWNIYVRSPTRLACFDRNPVWTPAFALNEKCGETGEMFLPEPNGVIRHQSIEYPTAIVTTVRTSK